MTIHKTKPTSFTLHCCVLVALLSHPLGLLADVLVVTGATSSFIALSKNQVRDVFLGEVVSLPDGSGAVPVDLPESSPLRDEFYSKVANKSTAQAKAHWAILHFTGRGVPPRECRDSGEVKEILSSTPGAIGYIERSSLDSSVKVIFDAQ
jgi:ABC-type phosphate transport system substrate-binding protein